MKNNVNSSEENESVTLCITENCLVSYIDEEDEDKDDLGYMYALRNYYYYSIKNTAEEAILDFINFFDINKVGNATDNFFGECLESSLVKIEII